MATQPFSRFRLVLNGAGSAALALFCIPMAISLAVGLASLPGGPPEDPDAGKAVWIYVIGIVLFALTGALAVRSLVRTAKAWRGSQAASRNNS